VEVRYHASIAGSVTKADRQIAAARVERARQAKQQAQAKEIARDLLESSRAFALMKFPLWPREPARACESC
jgi:hypothetical protein